MGLRRGARWAIPLLLAIPAVADPAEKVLDLRHLGVVPGTSGQVNYYRMVEDPHLPFLHAAYQPGTDTLMPGVTIPDGEDHTWRKLRWKWRALVLPVGGNECNPDKGDSAASVYLGWRRALHWYAIKYSWSTVAQKGAFCDRKGNPFRSAETVILQSGGPLNTWVSESVDLDAEWRRHFADGDPKAEVPPFIGIGILTDGDQTKTPASADFADFVLSVR